MTRPGGRDPAPAAEQADPAGGVGETVEHRLALVMNGGVSLAVWMGGVAREIDAARRASNGIPPPDDAGPGRRLAHDLWVRAMANARVRLTVDVIAGTSAGGLNGVLLATAIARGTDLAPLKQLWHESAQMSTGALFTPRADGVRSLMNGAYFKDRIEQILATLTARPDGGPDHGRDVTLIVTATALGASARPVTDSAGRAFLEADHRRRFRFSRHAGTPTFVPVEGGYAFEPGSPVDDFAAPEPLATAGRASASYPAAFEPQRESELLRAQRVFPDWETGPRLEWLADGGILDNSPFDPVLDAIEAQHVSGQWQRTLVYVVPAAEEAALGQEVARSAEGPAVDATAVPPPWTSVVLSALNLPRESDFRDDIERLHRTIRFGRASFDVRRFQRMTAVTPDGSLTTAAASLIATARQVSTDVMALYRQTSRSTAVYEVRDLLARSFGGYLEPTIDDTVEPSWPGPRRWLPEFPTAGAMPTPDWGWGVNATERVLRVMLRSLRESDGADTARADLSSAIAHVAAVQRAADEHLVSALFALVATSEGGDVGDDVIVKQLDDTYTALDIPANIAPSVIRAVTSFAAYLGGDVAPADVLAAALAIEVSNGSGSLPSERARPIFAFDRLGLDNPPLLLDFDYRAALAEPGASPSKILYGTRLSHFAAFGAPEWRDWDWLWGRLCGLAHLARVLGLEEQDVKELTLAIIGEERGADGGGDLEDGWQKLPQVQGRIGEVLAVDFESMVETMREGGVLEEALDAALEFVRSTSPTDPALPGLLPTVGRLISDLVSRNDDEIEHDTLRGAFNLWPEPHLRDRIWHRIER